MNYTMCAVAQQKTQRKLFRFALVFGARRANQVGKELLFPRMPLSWKFNSALLKSNFSWEIESEKNAFLFPCLCLYSQFCGFSRM